jgi:hypothetical protein
MKPWQIIISIVFFGAVWYFWDIWAALLLMVYLAIVGASYEKIMNNMSSAYTDEIRRLQNENARLRQGEKP